MYQAGIMVFSVAIWFAFLLLMAILTPGSKDTSMAFLATSVMAWPSFWLAVLLCMAFSLIPEFLWLVARRWLWPEDFHIAQYLQATTRKIRRYIDQEKKVPKRLLKDITVLEMARSLEGVDPQTVYSGFAYSGTAGGRATLALSTNAKFDAF